MSDLESWPGRRAGISREMLIAIILEFAESDAPVTALPWRPAFFADSKSLLAGTRIEALCRKILREYGPRKAWAFTAPTRGEDPRIHTAQENARVYEAFEARLKFKLALRQICESDEIFRLAPREAVMDLLELRDLLKSFPEIEQGHGDAR